MDQNQMSAELENLLGNAPQPGDRLVGPDGDNAAPALPRIPAGLERQPQQQRTPQPPTGPAQDLSKFEGKSREDVIQSYQELQSKIGEMGQKMDTAERLLNMMDPWFNLDPSTGKLTPNDDTVNRYISWRDQQRNPEPPPRMQSSQQTPPPPQYKVPADGDNFDRLLEENPREAIRLIAEQVSQQNTNRAFDERVTPFQNRFLEQQYDTWREKLIMKYPDYEQWESQAVKLAKAKRAQIDGIQDIEFWYNAAKANGGGFVDKREVQNFIKDLERSQSIIGARQFTTRAPISPDATTEELIGLNQYGQERNSSIVETLFGKRQLAPG